MLSRRAFVGKLAAGATGAAVVLTGTERAGALLGREATASGNSPESVSGDPAANAGGPTEDAPPPWEFLSPLTMGSEVAHGWRVAGLTPVVHGACVLTLESERGRKHRIHVCRNDGNPQGLVYTGLFDLVVMNGGEGDVRTTESLAQAVAEVSHVLARNEISWKQELAVTAMMPHSDRVRLFSGPESQRLR